jgi:hypothetical protein
MSDSQAVAIRSSTDLAKLDEFEDAILNGTRIEAFDDPETVSRAILLQLQAAQSNFELEPVDAQGWAELEGVPIEVRGFSWRPSKYEEGSSVYTVVHGTRLDVGEPVVLTTSGRNVLMQLANLARRGQFPCVRMLTENEEPTERGFHPLWLRTPPGYELEGVVVAEEDES